MYILAPDNVFSVGQPKLYVIKIFHLRRLVKNFQNDEDWLKKSVSSPLSSLNHLLVVRFGLFSPNKI